MAKSRVVKITKAYKAAGIVGATIRSRSSYRDSRCTLPTLLSVTPIPIYENNEQSHFLIRPQSSTPNRPEI